MRIRFKRLGCDIELREDMVSTLQIEDRPLFARIVRSLISELGEYSDEPYLIVGSEEKLLNPKKALWVINNLPEVPCADKQLVTQLYRKVVEQSEYDSRRYERIQGLMNSLISEIESIGDDFGGSYSFDPSWELETYLKAFGFSLESGEGYSAFENGMRFFELCADVAFEKPLVFVNAKSFFSAKELDELFEKAVFSKIRTLFIESWVDDASHKHENKIVIDQQFCVL